MRPERAPEPADTGGGHWECKVKSKRGSLDIAPFTILNSGALQPRKWHLPSIDCSTAAQANGSP